MPSGDAKIYAVLTGDVVASTALRRERLEAVRRQIVAAINDLEEERPGSRKGEVEFFRGDSWQQLLCAPGEALRLSLLIRARLRAATGARTRISIGIGCVDEVVEDRISMSTGDAFTASGRALDAMPRYFELTGALPQDHTGPLATWLPATLHLCSGLMRRWTRKQAEQVGLGLLLSGRPTLERIAKSLTRKVTAQTVQEALQSAGWRPLIDAVATFEATNWEAILATRAEDPDRGNALQ